MGCGVDVEKPHQPGSRRRRTPRIISCIQRLWFRRSAVALAEVGQFREAVQHVQKAAKALYESAKEVFERLKASLQRLVELFVETVTRMLAWIDEHKAYLFLMAAAAAGVIVLSVALNIWSLIKLEKLAYAASAPFVAGLADTGGKAAERFKTLAERYEGWKMDERLIDGVLKAPLKGERPYTAFLKLSKSVNLSPPLVELRRALARVKDDAEKDAAVVAALVLCKTLVKNAKAYGDWVELFEWARGLVEKQEFTVTTSDIERLRGAQKMLEEAAEEVRRELNSVLVLYKSHSRDLYEKLRPHLEVDVEKAEELAEARSGKLSKYSNASMGTKAYAALLSVARGGLYGHAAMLLMGEGALADVVLSAPVTACDKAWKIAKGRGRSVGLSRVGASDWEDRSASVLLRFLIGHGEIDPQLLSGASEMNLKFKRVEKDDKKERVVKDVGGDSKCLRPTVALRPPSVSCG